MVSAYTLVIVSNTMPSDDQYPNRQSHDQMLVRNAGSQTCWVVLPGSQPSPWLSHILHYPKDSSASSLSIWWNRDRSSESRNLGKELGIKGTTWKCDGKVLDDFDFGNLEWNCAWRQMQITTGICLPASMTLTFMHALLAFASGMICTQTYPASWWIPPQIVELMTKN